MRPLLFLIAVVVGLIYLYEVSPTFALVLWGILAIYAIHDSFG